MTVNEPKFSLTETLDAFAQRAVAEFPELKDRFALYCAPTDTLHGSLDDADKERFPEIMRDKVQEVEKLGFTLSASGHHTPDEYYDYYLMIFKEQEWRVHTSINSPYKKEVQAIAEHELGHLVAPAGLDRPLSEIVAEIFSIIHQQQLYPTNRETLEQIEARNAFAPRRLITRSFTSHFDLPALLELKRIAETYELPRIHMTPVQAANFAYRLALFYSPSKKSMEQLKKYFEPIAKQLTEVFGEDVTRTNKDAIYEAAQETAKLILKDSGRQSSLTFKTAKAFLKPYLDKRDDLFQDWARDEFSVFDGDFWDSVRDKIQERTLQEEAETTEQRLAHEARDMMVFGRFDKDSGQKIDPAAYEAKENMDYLHRARDAYTAIRYFQETGKLVSRSPVKGLKIPDVATLDQKQVVALARRIADKLPVAKFLTSNPPRKTPVAI
jgi:hypothetical protein